jgi:hypothetical protein
MDSGSICDRRLEAKAAGAAEDERGEHHECRLGAVVHDLIAIQSQRVAAEDKEPREALICRPPRHQGRQVPRGDLPEESIGFPRGHTELHRDTAFAFLAIGSGRPHWPHIGRLAQRFRAPFRPSLTAAGSLIFVSTIVSSLAP